MLPLVGNFLTFLPLCILVDFDSKTKVVVITICICITKQVNMVMASVKQVKTSKIIASP